MKIIDNIIYIQNNKAINFYKDENDCLYISEKDIPNIFLCNNEEIIISDFKKFINRESIDYNENKHIENNIILYNINLVLYYGYYEYLNQTKIFYSFLKENNLTSTIWMYLCDVLENKTNKSSFLKIFKNYENIFSTIEKLKTSEHSKNYSAFFIPDENLINDMISKLKDEYYLDDDFGVLKEKDSFKNITSDFYENYFDYDNLSYENNLSSFTYLFLKAMPYISGNEEILCGIILLDLINNNDLYSKNYTYLNEIDLGIFIKEATENLKEDPLYLKEKITKLFYYEKNPTIRYKDPDSSLLKESTQENIINYIVEFIQKNKVYSGRYDYFKGKEPTKDPNDPFSEFYTSNVYKLHFHCEFNNFKLNVGKSMTKQNTLVFNVDGNAYIEAPIDLNRRDLFILNIYDEIKNKLAPDAFEELETDAIKKLDISLNHKLKDIFDIKKLKFEYIINWNIEITTDNGY